MHDGEVEVMILSQEKGADLLILDDNAAEWLLCQCYCGRDDIETSWGITPRQ